MSGLLLGSRCCSLPWSELRSCLIRIAPPTSIQDSNYCYYCWEMQVCETPQSPTRALWSLTIWTTFWQSFEAAVYDNPDLSKLDKSGLSSTAVLARNKAREDVSGISLTDANYVEAVSILKKRFGGTQQIISKHMEALPQVEAVLSSQNVKALQYFFHTISSHIRSQESLLMWEETYGNLLCPVLVKKIPPDLRLILSRKIPEEE